MNRDSPDELWQAWQQSLLRGWSTALAGTPPAAPYGSGPQSSGPYGLMGAGLGLGASADPTGVDAFAGAWLRVAEDLRRLLDAPVPTAGTGDALATFAARFFGGEPRPAPDPPAASAGAVALGPLREHQRRAAALAGAWASLAAAQREQAALLAGAGRHAADSLRRRVAESPPTGPRALFDLWIDCAEAAWLELAHGESWCAAQARAFDAAVAVRACHQAIADHAARLAGLPTRADVDALERRLRDLEHDHERRDDRAHPDAPGPRG